MLDSTSPPPPPPPLLPLKTLASPPVPSTAATAAEETVSSPSSLSYNPSLLIITAIIIFVMLASFAIHLLLRILSRRPPLPLVHPRSLLSSSSSSSGPAVAAVNLVSNEKEKKDREAAIESLPVFTLASALAVAPKSAADCAVCLSRFQPHDELRLLPACCHAFHQSCVDAWLRSTPSCPLCRASIYLPPAPPQPLLAAPVNPSMTTGAEHQEAARSGSFRIEIGSVSRRRSNTTAADGEADPPPVLLTEPAHGRSYSLGSAYEYLVEEEVEAVVARALRRPVVSKEQKQEDHDSQPQPPGSEVAEVVGESSRGGSWLRDYVDRLASSASSSFSSLRFSSSRFESSAVADELLDIEENHHRVTTPDAEDVVASSAFYKWFMGAYS